MRGSLRLMDGLRVISIVLSSLFVGTARGEVIVEHVGNNDPTTEGWGLDIVQPGFSSGPVESDFGYVSAWNFATIASNADVAYRFGLNDQQIAASIADGWSLTVALRVVSANGTGLRLLFLSGTKTFGLVLMRSPQSDDLFVRLQNSTVRVNGNADAYHVFHMTDDDASGLIDLYIDGVLAISDEAIPDSPTSQAIVFGDLVGGAPENSHANYALVRFTTNFSDPAHGCTESVIDCNGNAVLDPCEHYVPPAIDCNANSVLDACEIGADASLDCNANGDLDECDLSCGSSSADDYVIVAANTPSGGNPAYDGPVFQYSMQGTGDMLNHPNIPPEFLSDPAGVTFDEFGELFVGNRHGNVGQGLGSISRFKFDGCGEWRFNGQITGNGLEAVHQIAFSPDNGEMFAVNYIAGTVSRFKFDSARHATPNGIINAAVHFAGGGLAMSPWGELFVVASHSIKRYVFDDDGTAIENGTIPTTSLNGSGFLDFDPDGNLYYASLTENTLFRCLFDQAKEASCEGILSITNLDALAITPSRELLVAVHGDGGIWRFLLDEDGNPTPHGFIPTASLGDIAVLDLNSIRTNDCDFNLVPDECELVGQDCNENGHLDSCDVAGDISLDCNASGVPDECELADSDCNVNGVPDDCDINSGASQDQNASGVPDECEAQCGNGKVQTGEECDGLQAGNCPSGFCRPDCMCQPLGIPAVSEWGLTILALAGLIAGSLLFRQKIVI